MKAIRNVLAAALVALACFAGAAEAAPVPELKGRVNDYASVFTPEEARALDEQLAAIEALDGNPQFAVLTVESLEEDQDVRDFGIEVANSWKLGRAELNNGLLIVLITGDASSVHGSIETGTGLEGALPDGRLSAIFRHVMQPHLGAKSDRNYYQAVSAGLTAMQKYVKGEFTDDMEDLFAAAAARDARYAGGFIVGVIGILICAALTYAFGHFVSGWTGVFFGIAVASIAFEMSFYMLLLFAIVGFPVGALSPIILEIGVQVLARGKGGGGGWKGGGGGFSGGGIRF